MSILNQIAYFQDRRDQFIRTLERRLPDLSASQAARIKRVIKQAEKA